MVQSASLSKALHDLSKIKKVVDVIDCCPDTIESFRSYRSIDPDELSRSSLPLHMASIDYAVEKIRIAAERAVLLPNLSQAIKDKFLAVEGVVDSLLLDCLKPSSIEFTNSIEMLTRLKNENPSKFTKLYFSILERIQTETSFFKSLEEFGIDAAIRESFSSNPKLRFEVKMSDEARFSRITGKIDIRSKRPEDVEILSELLEGRIHKTVASVFHETIHSTQVVRPEPKATRESFAQFLRSIFTPPKPISNPEVRLAREVHAFLSQLPLDSYSDCPFEVAWPVKRIIANNYANHYGASESTIAIGDGKYILVGDAININKAIAHIYFLQLIGLPNREIGVLIETSSWDNSTLDFTVLSERVAMERARHGLTLDSDFEIMAAGLSALSMLENAGNKNRVAEIACDELTRFKNLSEL